MHYSLIALFKVVTLILLSWMLSIFLRCETVGIETQRKRLVTCKIVEVIVASERAYAVTPIINALGCT